MVPKVIAVPLFGANKQTSLNISYVQCDNHLLFSPPSHLHYNFFVDFNVDFLGMLYKLVKWILWTELRCFNGH